jgi:hypothetical protein
VPSGSDQGRIGRRQLLLGGLLLAGESALFAGSAQSASRFGEGGGRSGTEGGKGSVDLTPAGRVGEHLLELAREVPIEGEELARAWGASRLASAKADPEALATELLAAGKPLDDLDAVRDALARRIHQDFVEGETQKVAGWLLSRAEVRFLALAIRASADAGPTTPAAA